MIWENNVNMQVGKPLLYGVADLCYYTSPGNKTQVRVIKLKGWKWISNAGYMMALVGGHYV